MTRSATVLWLALGYGAFVVYGSLVPLVYQPLSLDAAWARFQHIPFLALGIDARADWVANGVLYAPLAFLAARAGFDRGRARAAAIVLAVAVCCALAVGVEFLQLWFPARTVSLNDIVAECLGSAAGALLAPLTAPWLRRAAGDWLAADRGALLTRLLTAYALGYLALSFFPYDLLLSAAEVAAKARSPQWGWVVAPGVEPGSDKPLLTALKLALEVALTLPIGLLLARRRAAAGVGTAFAFAVGAGLGVSIEVGQFFIATGVSEGASVLTRGLGVALGAAPALRRSLADAAALRRALARRAPVLALAWLVLLLAVNGLWTSSWHGPAAAAAVWRQLSLLPFYYHYYTSEAIALQSLFSVALMYLPLALIGWALRQPPWRAVAAAAVAAAAVETAKLFVDGLRPDPTDVLIAAVAVAACRWLLDSAAALRATPAGATAGSGAGTAGSSRRRAWQATTGGTEQPPDAILPTPGATTRPHAGMPPAAPWPVAHGPLQTAGTASPSASRPLGATALPLLAVAVALLAALRFPVAPAALPSLLMVCGALVCWRPVLVLALLPAALPVLDLAPWSGRFFSDEFDLLSAVCIAVAWLRTPRPPGRRGLHLPTLALALVDISLACSSLRALVPWPGVDAGSFDDYFSAFNALRIAKGAVWAALVGAVWLRLRAAGAACAPAFRAGMVAGLALTVLAVLLERAAFTGLWDFGADYRVTALFSAMHKGGAFIECWLAVAQACALAWLLDTRRATSRVLAALVVLGAAYAMLVTYSRSGYVAAFAVVLVLLATTLRRRSAAWWLGGGLALLLAALPLLVSPYARERIARAAPDAAVRLAHLRDAANLRDGDWPTRLVGIGLGRYPQAHYWRSHEPVHAATYGLARDGERRLLRLGTGATLYVEQIVDAPTTAPWTLRLLLRAPKAAADGATPLLRVALCEKWTLTSRACVAAEHAAAATWQEVVLTLDAPALQRQPQPWPRPPLKLALLTPEHAAIEVAELQLTAPGAATVLRNGDFAAGLDHWFFSTDVDPPWQLHSLPATVWLELGWLGVAAWLLAIAGALVAGTRLALRRAAALPEALAATVGFLVVGSVNTLIDAPRFLGLLLLLLWLCALPATRQPADATAA